MGFLIPLGLALSAAGTGMSVYSSIEAGNRMEDQIRNQLLKQKGFQNQATPVFERALAQSSPTTVSGQRKAGEQRAGELYQKLAKMPLSSSTAANPLDPRAQARIQGQVGQQQRAGAMYQGFQEAANQQALGLQESGRELGVISNLSQASAANTSALTQLAGMSTADMQAIGTGFSTLGGLGALYGAMQPRIPANVNQPTLSTGAGSLAEP